MQKETKLFFLYAHVKNIKSFGFISMLGLIEEIKNIKQNIQENIVLCWFVKQAL